MVQRVYYLAAVLGSPEARCSARNFPATVTAGDLIRRDCPAARRFGRGEGKFDRIVIILPPGLDKIGGS
jgi:hypothetical protein|tara:strand:- start:584 stop:790 length:207 start_codon:yes stop_codon:yes gene_type:complete